jgi:hypothetical protein
MQTPKPTTNSITHHVPPYIPSFSPYRTKIQQISQTITEQNKYIKKYLLIYKYFSQLSPICSLATSGCLLLFHSTPILSSTYFTYLLVTHVTHLFTYTIIQPSQKYIIHKEVYDGLQTLKQSIDFYLLKHNQDDMQNYITFETLYSKLLKKCEPIN